MRYSNLPAAGHSIKVLSRSAARASQILGVPVFDWDYAREPIPDEALVDVQGIIHLISYPPRCGIYSSSMKAYLINSDNR